MNIKIIQEDIDKGRTNATETCGCPIWHAVVRQLGLTEAQADDLVCVSDYWTLEIGGTKFKLPPEAVSLQRVLAECPLAHIEPIEFFAPVESFKKEKEQEAPPNGTQEKPSLLERIFG